VSGKVPEGFNPSVSEEEEDDDDELVEDDSGDMVQSESEEVHDGDLSEDDGNSEALMVRDDDDVSMMGVGSRIATKGESKGKSKDAGKSVASEKLTMVDEEREGMSEGESADDDLVDGMEEGDEGEDNDQEEEEEEEEEMHEDDDDDDDDDDGDDDDNDHDDDDDDDDDDESDEGGRVINAEDAFDVLNAGESEEDGKKQKLLDIIDRQIQDQGSREEEESESTGGKAGVFESGLSDSHEDVEGDGSGSENEEGRNGGKVLKPPHNDSRARGNTTFSEAAERRVSAKVAKAERRAMFEREANNTYRDAERDRRTVFVGGVPCAPQHHRTRSALMSLFRRHGSVESVRFRSFSVQSSKLSKAEAFRRHQFGVKDTMNAYIVYTQEKSARAAAAANNGKTLTVLYNPHELKGANLTVDVEKEGGGKRGLAWGGGGYSHNVTTVMRCDVASGGSYVSSRCIFVGNVPFTGVTEQDMRELFKKCGAIENVRIVRDKVTGNGKGFCYVQFADEGSVLKAVELNNHNETRPIIRIGNKKFDVSLSIQSFRV
jgi:hypothetical protein